MPGLGSTQRRVRRAFIANPGARLTTADLIRWSYPRLKGKTPIMRYLSVSCAAKAVADKVGRTYPGGFIWQLKPAYLLPSGKTKIDQS
jgi:hypothetical protein